MLEIGNRKQLFIFDDIIAEKRGVERRQNAFKKFGSNPVLRWGAPWGERMAFVYGTVSYEDGLFRMWYTVQGDARDWAASIAGVAYATSTDGVHWEKPRLGLVDWLGSKENNLVYCTGYRGNPNIPSIVRHEQEADPTRRYKMFYWDIVQEKRGLWVATSPDGLRWSRVGEGPVLTDTGDVLAVVWDEERKRFAGYFKRRLTDNEGQVHRATALGFSDDGLHWSDEGMIIVPDDIDQAWARGEGGLGVDFYGHCGFPYEDIHCGLLWRFLKTSPWRKVQDESSLPPSFWRAQGEDGAFDVADDGPIDIQLTYSRDGLTWERSFDRAPIIPRGEAGDFDSGVIYTANRPVIVGDEIWVYYGGGAITHAEDPWRVGPHAGMAVGLAKARLDGFVSLGARAADGTLTTVPFA